MVDSVDIVNYGEARVLTEEDEVTLDGLSLPVGSTITSYTSRFESKLTFGDYSKDSDQLLSTWIQSLFAGGLLIDDHSEGATDQRGRWAKAWTMTPEQLALPPKHDTLQFGPTILSSEADAQGHISMPLAEIGGVLYVAMGKQLWKVAADPYSYTNVTYTFAGLLNGYAQGQAAILDTRQYMVIPMGEGGVGVWRTHLHPTLPDTQVSGDASIKAIGVVTWDTKTFALTRDRYLRILYQGSPTWEAASPALKLPDDEEPRNISLFYDQSGNEAVFIVTNRRIWAYDHEVGKIYPSSLAWPKHHNTGLGFTPWRDDALYISSGLAVTRYTRDGVRTDMGLDRDDGIPAERIGQVWGKPTALVRPSNAITSMTGTQNFIAALVQLGAIIEVNDPKACPYALVVWNESGWHVLHEESLIPFAGRGAGRYPVGLYVTENVGGYRLWWGEGASKHQGGDSHSSFEGKPILHSMAIPRAFHGPKQKVLDNLEAFAPSGYYETGWFDAGMRGFDKTWSHLEVHLTDPGTGVPLSGGVDVQYRTDDDPNHWRVLGAVTSYGRTVLPFNVDGAGMPRGQSSRSIELRFVLFTSAENQSPIINSFILKYIKLPLPGRAWQIAVPLEARGWKNHGPREIQAILARKTYEGGFSEFLDDRKYRVRISQVQVTAGAGSVPDRHIQVNLIEVPIVGDPVWGGDA